MTAGKKKAMKWGSAIGAVLWMLIVGVMQFNDMGGFDYGDSVREEQLQKQLRKCKGSFKVRYECKSRILRVAGRDTVNYWGKKLMLTFVPALLIYVIFHLWLKRVEWDEEKERRRLRLIRIEKQRQKESRFAKEEGRQRTGAAKRRQSVQQAVKDAVRAERKRPLNVMCISQDDEFVESLRASLWEEGYYLIQTDLRDVFFSYKEIGYHIILSETDFNPPKIHKEDLNDEKYPGHPLPLAEALAKLRERKDNVRIIAMSKNFVDLSTDDYIEAAANLGADAVIEKPFEMEKLLDLFSQLMDTGSTAD